MAAALSVPLLLTKTGSFCEVIPQALLEFAFIADRSSYEAEQLSKQPETYCA